VEDKDHPNDIDGYFVCGLTDAGAGHIRFIAPITGCGSIDGTKYAATRDGRAIAQFANYEEAANRSLPAQPRKASGPG
jgi:hypothetical protein